MSETRKSYSEKLRDPRWQKKRLKILERDGWACQRCGDTTKTLHVHHRWYERGAEPWEYEDAALQTLCEDCHGTEYQLRPQAEAILLDALRFICGWYEVTELAEILLQFEATTPDHSLLDRLREHFTRDGQ